MKNFVIAVAVILVLLLAGVVVLRSLSSSAIGEADRAFAASEPEARFVARYPAIAAKNASAARLEEITAALQVDIRSAQETGKRKTFDVDPAVMRGMTSWLQAQHERADDGCLLR